MLPGTMSNTLQKSKSINRVNFIKLLRMPTKIQHQDCLIRSCLETSVPWNYVSTSRSHMTLPNCNYQLLETSHSLTLEQWHFMSFSSQVFQAVFDKWNHFCDLTDRIWPRGLHRGSPWRDTAPTRVRVWPPSHQQLHLYVKPKLCVWWHILCTETKKRVKATTFRGNQRLPYICKNWVPFYPSFTPSANQSNLCQDHIYCTWSCCFPLSCKPNLLCFFKIM